MTQLQVATVLRSNSSSSSCDDCSGAKLHVVHPTWQPPEPVQDLSPHWAGHLPTLPLASLHADRRQTSNASEEEEADEAEDIGDAQVLRERSHQAFYRVPVQQRLSQHWSSCGEAEEVVETSCEAVEEVDMEEAAWGLMEEMLRDATPRTKRRIMRLFALGQRTWKNGGGDSLEGPEGPQGHPADLQCTMPGWCGGPRRAGDRSCVLLPRCDLRKTDAAHDASAGEGALWRRAPGNTVQQGSAVPTLFWKLPTSNAAPVSPWRPQPESPGNMTMPYGSSRAKEKRGTLTFKL